MKYNYPIEKFGMAVHVLATNRHEIKTRLLEAFIEIVMLSEKDMPDALKEDFNWVKNTLTKNPPKTIRCLREGKVVEESTGSLGATVPYMRINKAVLVAERICYIETRLQNEYRDV